MDPNVIPNVSVDCVVIGYDLQDISILLIEREMVYNGKKYIDLKLPGDLVRWDEDIDSSAYRILFDLSGVQISNLKQLQAFGEVDRLKKEPRDMEWLRAIDHPEERVITVAYYTLVSLDLIHSQKFKPNPNARWVPISKIGKLAFDHNRIINKALDTLRQEIKQTPVAFDLLPRKYSFANAKTL